MATLSFSKSSSVLLAALLASTFAVPAYAQSAADNATRLQTSVQFNF